MCTSKWIRWCVLAKFKIRYNLSCDIWKDGKWKMNLAITQTKNEWFQSWMDGWMNGCIPLVRWNCLQTLIAFPSFQMHMHVLSIHSSMFYIVFAVCNSKNTKHKSKCVFDMIALYRRYYFCTDSSTFSFSISIFYWCCAVPPSLYVPTSIFFLSL